MPDQLLDELPILRELGDDLKAAFRASEPTRRGLARLPRSSRRLLLSAAGLVAVAAGVAAGFVLGFQGGSSTPASATAALLEAAQSAAHRPQPFPTNSQFWYLRSQTTVWAPILAGLPFHCCTPEQAKRLRAVPKARVTSETQSWISPDRAGLEKIRVVSVHFPSAAARRRWERLGRPSFLPMEFPTPTVKLAPVGKGIYLLGNLELTRDQLLAAPTDPHKLYRRLYAAGNGTTAEVFVEIEDTLRAYPSTARLRAALYRTLALVPGIRLIGSVRDSVGRRGTAVAIVQHGLENELIFNTATSDMLEERSIIVSKHLGIPGTITESTTYLQRAVTNTLTPPAR